MPVPAPQEPRLRQHPSERFAVPQLLVDLETVISKLRSEPHAGERGHRQETLYRRGGFTVALFAFDRFTGLSNHKAKGIVNIHVLRGCMKIIAADQVHELRAGQMVILAPGLEHAVAAEEEGEILVTVYLTEMVDNDLPPPT